MYAVAAVLFGGVLTVVSRLRIAEERGRRRAARALPDGAIIIVSNHASYVDGILLALVCRRMGRSGRLLATAGVFRIPVVGRLARAVGFIPVQRRSSSAADALEPAAQALAAGEAVGIFPEGRTTRDPRHWLRSILTSLVLRPEVLTEVGDPIDVVAMARSGGGAQGDVRELTDEVWSRIVALVEDLRSDAAPNPRGVDPADA